MRLYLDLDGVMADFDRHFRETFGLDNRSLAEAALWERINTHPTFFRDLPVCDGALSFFDRFSYAAPIILTACPRTNYQHVARQKRAWVYEHLSPHCTVLPVMGGRNKPLFMHSPGDILIDDFERNIAAWDDEGGVGILHRDFEQTKARLKAVLA